jgi:hypothetical protein
LPSDVDASNARALLALGDPTPIETGVGRTIAILRRGVDRGLVASP